MTVKAIMKGGPCDGLEGELAGAPITLAFGDAGGFVYHRDDVPEGQVQTYTYDPAVSPAHEAVVEADRQAIREVAAEKGITVQALLAEVMAGKKDRDGVRPADMLIAEAARLGITPFELMAQGYDPVSGLYLPEHEGATP